MAKSKSLVLFLSWCSSTSSIQPIFLWYSPARSLTIGLLLGGAPGAASRNVVTSASQLQFQESHHSEHDRKHSERVGFLNRHSAALGGKYRCSWCSLKTLVGRRLRVQRRSGIRSRCAFSVASVTRREAQHSRASSLVQTNAGRWGSSPPSDPSKLACAQAGPHCISKETQSSVTEVPCHFLTMSSCSCANSRFQ